MLTNFEDELKVLENLLSNQDSIRKENVAIDEECSHMFNHDRSFNVQLHSKNLGRDEDGGHRDVECKDKCKTHLQHSVMNLEDEMIFFEKWLANDVIDEDCRNVAELEEQMVVSNGFDIRGILKRNPEDIIQDMMQQLVDINNIRIQQKEGINKW